MIPLGRNRTVYVYNSLFELALQKYRHFCQLISQGRVLLDTRKYAGNVISVNIRVKNIIKNR